MPNATFKNTDLKITTDFLKSNYISYTFAFKYQRKKQIIFSFKCDACRINIE